MGTKKAFQEKESIYSKIKHPLGRLSICLNPDNPIIFKSDFEFMKKYFVLKDSNNEIFL